MRFYLFRVATFGQDGSISIDGLHERYERELGNDLGNLLSRTTAMISRYRDGELRRTGVSADLAAELDRTREGVAARLDEFDLTGGLELVWELVRALNRHVEQVAPWELAKDEARADDLDRAALRAADGLRAVAVALAAFVPETAERILAALRQPPELAWDRVAAGQDGRSRRDRAGARRFSRAWTSPRRRPSADAEGLGSAP